MSDTINIPNVGYYNNTKTLEEQEQVVLDYCHSLLEGTGQCTDDEFCANAKMPDGTIKEVKRPKELCFADEQKGVVLIQWFNYGSVSPTAANAFQFETTTHKMEEIGNGI